MRHDIISHYDELNQRTPLWIRINRRTFVKEPNKHKTNINYNHCTSCYKYSDSWSSFSVTAAEFFWNKPASKERKVPLNVGCGLFIAKLVAAVKLYLQTRWFTISSLPYSTRDDQLITGITDCKHSPLNVWQRKEFIHFNKLSGRNHVRFPLAALLVFIFSGCWETLGPLSHLYIPGV